MIKRMLPVILCAAFAGAQAQNAAQKITFGGPVGPAAKVLPLLGNAAGVDLKSSPSTAADTLMVKVSGVGLNAVMDRIAKTLRAEWIKDGESYQLVRSSSAEKRMRDEETSRLAARIKASVAKMAPTDIEPWDATTANRYTKAVVDRTERAFERSQQRRQGEEVYGDVSLNNPSGRALWRVLSAIDPSLLAGVGSRRVVFSNSPNRMQLRLPSACTETLTTFIHEQKLLEQAVKEAEEQSTSKYKESIFHMDSLADASESPGNPRLGLGRALFVVQRVLGNTFQLQLTIFDPNGLKIGGVIRNLEVPLTKEPMVVVKEPTVIPFTPLTIEFAGILNSKNRPRGIQSMIRSTNDAGQLVTVNLFNFPDGSRVPRASAELREAVLKPDERDPMSFAPAEAIGFISDRRKEDVVAWLPDDSFIPMMAAVSPKLTVGDFLTRGPSNWDLEVREADGWMTISPRFPVTSGSVQVNRPALGILLRALATRGYLKLADVSAFALASNPAELVQRYLETINLAAGSRLWSMGDWRLLKFYGSLTDAQRAQATGQSQIPLLNLSDQQATLLADMVFNSVEGPFVGAPEAGAALDPWERLARTGVERTDLLPNGVVTNGYFALGSESLPAAFAENADTGSSLFMTADEAASQRLQPEGSDPTLPRFVGPPSSFDQYRTATVINHRFLFVFANDLSYSQSLRDADMVEGSERGPYESLSSGFRREVDAKSNNMRQALRNWVNASSQRSVPPPDWAKSASRKVRGP